MCSLSIVQHRLKLQKSFIPFHWMPLGRISGFREINSSGGDWFSLSNRSLRSIQSTFIHYGFHSHQFQPMGTKEISPKKEEIENKLESDSVEEEWDYPGDHGDIRAWGVVLGCCMLNYRLSYFTKQLISRDLCCYFSRMGNHLGKLVDCVPGRVPYSTIIDFDNCSWISQLYYNWSQFRLWQDGRHSWL